MKYAVQNEAAFHVNDSVAWCHKRSSTGHAIYCLKETINHFTENGSNVYCYFLDASKAFDRVFHMGLYLKMLQRGVPFVFLEVMMY